MENKHLSSFEVYRKYNHINHGSYRYADKTINAVKEILKLACYFGKIDVAKWLIDLEEDEAGDAFVSSCCGGNMDIAVWLDSEYKYHISANDYWDAFQSSCEHGCLDIAKWLYSTGRIDLSEKFSGSIVLNKSISNGHLPVAEWLITLPEVTEPQCDEDEGECENIHDVMRDEFVKICENGWVNLAKWVHDYLSKNNVAIDYQTIFRSSCSAGQLEVICWLYSVAGVDKIDIHADDDIAFKESCLLGHLNILKWLTECGGEFNVTHDETFGLGMEFPLHVKKWLISEFEYTDESIDSYLPLELAEDAFEMGYRPVDRLVKSYEDYSRKKQGIIGEMEGHEIFGYRHLVKMMSDY